MAQQPSPSPDSPDKRHLSPGRRIIEGTSEAFRGVASNIGSMRHGVRNALLASLAFYSTADTSAHQKHAPAIEAGIVAGTPGEEVGMASSPDSPNFTTAQNTFARIYSTKAGTIFFIAPDGSIEKEFEIPKKIRVLLASKQKDDPKKFKDDRIKYKAEYAAFLKEARSSVSLEADLMQSNGKFREALAGSRKEIKPGLTIRERAAYLFEQTLKHKTDKQIKNDEETLWDIIDAEDRRLLIDMFSGLMGVESSYNPRAGEDRGKKTAKGITQLMPATIARLEMEPDDVYDIEKVIPKTAQEFNNIFKTLNNPGGPVDVMLRYNLKDGRFLIYSLVDAFHGGVGNYRTLCQRLLMQYPTIHSLPLELQQHLNSEEVYAFMTHRGDPGNGGYKQDSRNYVPQVMAMAAMFAEHDKKGGRTLAQQEPGKYIEARR